MGSRAVHRLGQGMFFLCQHRHLTLGRCGMHKY
jgi:hypothetical protein